MRKIRIMKGKRWQVNIDDMFTGESIQIDGYIHNNKPLKENEYLQIDTVKQIIESDKPLYLLSEV